MSTAREKWEYFGENDPYFAVSMYDKFKSRNIDDSAKHDFFQSGEDEIERVWAEITAHFEPDFRPENALDFGCGVGRLVFPLASRAEKVYGVDISRPMLDEAVLNSEEKGVANVVFQQVDEFLAADSPKFDLVHSYIVFQHIEPTSGLKILQTMIDRLNVGGIGVLHFTYKNPSSTFRKLRFAAYRDVPLIYRFRNLLKGNRNIPLMPMYVYDLVDILSKVRAGNCDGCLLRFSDHGFHGATIYFQKQS